MPELKITDPWNVATNFSWQPVTSNIPEYRGKVMPGIRISKLQEELHVITGPGHPENDRIYVDVLRGRVAHTDSETLGGEAFYVTDTALAMSIESTTAYKAQLPSSRNTDDQKTHWRARRVEGEQER